MSWYYYTNDVSSYPRDNFDELKYRAIIQRIFDVILKIILIDWNYDISPYPNDRYYQLKFQRINPVDALNYPKDNFNQFEY